jgi:regulator of sigma E protease
MSYIISLIIVLGVLIFFHELGHFLVARLCGVGVEKFSLGFGPRLLGKTIGLTDYRISAIPLGGYVKMVGEEPDADLEPEMIPLSFTHKNVFKRILIVASGPAFNLLLAVLIYFSLFQFYGSYELEPVVGKVMADSPAMKSGLKQGDRILSLDGAVVTSFSQLAEIVSRSNGKTIIFTIKRGDAKNEIPITPEKKADLNEFGEDVNRYLVGISPSGEHYRTIQYSPLGAITQSISQTYTISKLMIVGIVKLIKGDISAKNLGGPIMIAQMAGDQAKQGLSSLFNFIAFISVNLAIVNFLPIPVLDGGHLLFFLVEALTRRPVNIRMREIAQQVGIFILILLTLFVFYNDIMRLLS